MLTIRDDYADNHFSDKFVSPCHLDYFINTKFNSQIYLSHFLHFQRLNFVFSYFRDAFVNELHLETKVIIYPKYI